MSLTELLPSVQSLPREEKLRLMQFLVVELAHEDGISLLAADISYPIWSPYDAHEVAATLLGVLKEEEAKRA